MFTSWSEVSTPPELSIASVLILPRRQGELDPPALGDAEVGPLPHHPAAQLAGVHPHRVVGPVADLRVASRRRP